MRPDSGGNTLTSLPGSASTEAGSTNAAETASSDAAVTTSDRRSGEASGTTMRSSLC